MPPEAEPAPPELPPGAAPAETAPEPAAGPAAAGTPGPATAARAFYEQHKAALWAAGLLAPVLIVAVGWAVRPDLFYDQFLWRDLWGSAVADAGQTGRATHHGIVATEDYTLLSEVVYGAIMAVALYGIYVHVLQRFDVRVDEGFVAAILPFILFGPFGRTLEDTSLFCRPGAAGCEPNAFAYLFISPFLYAVIAVAALGFILVGVLLERSAAPARTKALFMAGLLFGLAAAYGVVWATMADQFRALAHPAVVFAGAAMGLALFAWLERRGTSGVNRSLAAGGVTFLFPSVYLVGLWLSGSPWSSTILGRMHLDAAPVILGLPLLCVLLVYGLGRFGAAREPRLAAYALPLNLGLVYGHMLDGFASFIAICSNAAATAACSGATVFGLDLPDYGEKHPVSAALLTYLDGWLFPIVKLALVLGIVWVLDVEYRKDLQKERNLGGLVKMAILILGLAPGTRDLLRLAMGT